MGNNGSQVCVGRGHLTPRSHFFLYLISDGTADRLDWFTEQLQEQRVLTPKVTLSGFREGSVLYNYLSLPNHEIIEQKKTRSFPELLQSGHSMIVIQHFVTKKIHINVFLLIYYMFKIMFSSTWAKISFALHFSTDKEAGEYYNNVQTIVSCNNIIKLKMYQVINLCLPWRLPWKID